MDTKDRKPDGRRPVSNTRRTGGSQTRNSQTVRAGTATKTRRRTDTTAKPSADVVYTQPGPFNKLQFLLHLATVIAVVLALLFGLSIFFKVKTVTVVGNNKYSAWDIREASGIQDGENLLTISEARITSSIREKLPYVDTVRVGINLPDTVKIQIEELDVVYAIESDNGSWWLMRADGGIVEETNSTDAKAYTQVLGVKITEPEIGQQAKAFQPAAEETAPDGQTVPVTVNAANQLSVAISILQFMEDNSVIGEAASVDVSDTTSLEMWYSDRFQILLGDESQLAYKITMVNTAINEYMESYDSGVLDASMTIQPDPEKEYQIIYTPFD